MVMCVGSELNSEVACDVHVEIVLLNHFSVKLGVRVAKTKLWCV